MKFILQIVPFFILLQLLYFPAASAQAIPETFILNGEQLLQNKLKVERGSLAHQVAVNELIFKADKILQKKPYTITDKALTPPSGSKNDYMSLAPYWWPNPYTADGLPYINKDGKTNPEVNSVKDQKHVVNISRDVETLGLAYYFTGREQYAKKAADLLCIFFIDAETKMNPNLNFGQSIRGVNDGRAIGLIDTQHFTRLIDGVQLLQGSEAWTAANQKALQNWFGQFVNWMLTSEVGKDGVKEPNNIGTFYDLQVVTYAMFSGNKPLARKYLTNTTLKRIDKQFDEEGRQPYELKRSRAWTYSIKNLNGWSSLAKIGDKAGVDIWNYTSKDGKNLKKGFLWMLPYANGQKEWEYKEIRGVKLEGFLPLAKTALNVYKTHELESYLNHPTTSLISVDSKNLLVH
ncbi:alginate lyase family protein [Pontibacter arcticus]|uniref:Alginate lyase domain-containing protein n=1 Tax=Pontibacter arcticus TaxID=2080288 RepID=A0A364RDJ3_9BACT|nr:alginate lyase family protein [Pontibacter arcticus]RAU82420.1 hypothetical protein DP923_11590 [Pontibacter arcticus]